VSSANDNATPEPIMTINIEILAVSMLILAFVVVAFGCFYDQIFCCNGSTAASRGRRINARRARRNHR
jgi:hypothetical protein